jgi:hypothetical protein
LLFLATVPGGPCFFWQQFLEGFCDLERFRNGSGTVPWLFLLNSAISEDKPVSGKEQRKVKEILKELRVPRTEQGSGFCCFVSLLLCFFASLLLSKV